MDDKIAREYPTRRRIKAPVRFFSDKRDLSFGAFFLLYFLDVGQTFWRDATKPMVPILHESSYLDLNYPKI